MTETIVIKTAQHLTFRLGDEVFALDVARVREILEVRTITKVPGAPEFMPGVINVRGRVVPVFDLRLRFGMSATQHTADTHIVLMEPSIDGETTIFATLADSVYEVLELKADHVEEPPKMVTRWGTEFIREIGKRNEQFIILLDIDRIFSDDELALVQDTSGEMLPAEAQHGAEELTDTE